MKTEHRTQILLRHYGNLIEEADLKGFERTEWDSPYVMKEIKQYPESFRLLVYSLEDITDEHLRLLGFSDRILDKIHCDKNGSFWYRKDSDAKLIDKAHVWEANEIDKLRSLGYATSQTVVIPKPEKEDYKADLEKIQTNRVEAYEQALDKWKKQPTKTYLVDELIKEGVFQIIKR